MMNFFGVGMKYEKSNEHAMNETRGLTIKLPSHLADELERLVEAGTSGSVDEVVTAGIQAALLRDCVKDDRRYGELLQNFKNDWEFVGVLEIAEKARASALQDIVPLLPVMDGIAAMIVHFYSLAKHGTCDAVSIVLFRAQEEIARGMETVLSGDAMVVNNVCRVLMEITVLLEEWTYKPDKIDLWMACDEKKRRNVFAFGKVLDRIRVHKGVDDTHKLREEEEYSYHSRVLHVTPDRGPAIDPSPRGRLDELIGHVDRLFRDTDRLFETLPEVVGVVEKVPLGQRPNVWIKALDWRNSYIRQRDDQLLKHGYEVDYSRTLPRDFEAKDLIRSIYTGEKDEDQS